MPINIPNYFYYSLSMLWLYSGIVPIAFNQSDSLVMLAKMGIPSNLQWALFILDWGKLCLGIAFTYD